MSSAKSLVSIALGALVASLLVCASSAHAGSEVPTSALTPWTQILRRDYVSIIEFRTIKLDDEPVGPSDLVVSGWQHRHGGLRVEVFRVERGRLVKRWDSAPFTRGAEFQVEGRPEIQVWGGGKHEYSVLIDGCAPHRCGGDLHGFLWFSGQTGKSGTARVSGVWDNKLSDYSTYDVLFSALIDEDSKRSLQGEICSSKAISNKAGLPFKCKAP